MSDDSTVERCEFCFEEGVWAFPGGASIPGNIYTPPRSHTVETLDEARTIKIDSCPHNNRRRPDLA
ncbi:hypothetical protein GCM10017673_14730 [Streptosporangium violaceochromogenes]|nr:hypothetical protein GCM10017673_14730 [Streptosporangium violaceochromogenes]